MRFLCRIGIHHRIFRESWRETRTVRGLLLCRYRASYFCVHCGGERSSVWHSDWEWCSPDRICGASWIPEPLRKPARHVQAEA